MRFSRLHWVFLLLFFSSFGLSVGQSFPAGVGQSANNGCLCHGSASNATETTLIGLPDVFESNQTYNLTVHIQSTVEQSNDSQGGFRLLVNAGTVVFENPSYAQQMDDGWTHTSEGIAERSWNFTWTAPQDNTTSVEFIVYGNAVNGNQNSMGDHWDGFGSTVPGSSFDGTLVQPVVDQPYEIMDYSIIIGGLFTILVLFYFAVK